MKTKFLAIILTIGLFVTGCSGSESNAMKLDVGGFAAKIAESDVVVLDVRTPMEFAEGHLENAINIDFQSDSFEADISKLDRDTAYAVYCRSGNRSGQAVKVMAGLGFTNLYDLDGGVIDWVAAGQTIIKEGE